MANADTHRLKIPRVDDFTVTGFGDDLAWERAEWFSLRKRTTTGASLAGGPPYETKVKVLYSAQGLYVLMSASDGVLTAPHNEDFAPLYEADVFEFFLWPDERLPIYFEYEISPLGYELPILVPNLEGNNFPWRPWRYEGERRSRRATTVLGGEKRHGATISGWRAEVFLPFALLQPLSRVPPTPGMLWRGNFYRIDEDHGKTTHWDWAPVGPTFHAFRDFGTLEFL